MINLGSHYHCKNITKLMIERKPFVSLPAFDEELTLQTAALFSSGQLCFLSASFVCFHPLSVRLIPSFPVRFPKRCNSTFSV